MSSLSRPQSSAAMRSPISHASGFSSPLKYSSTFNPDSTAIFASEERKFLSSRKGERQYPSSRELDRDTGGRNRSGSYSTSSSAASPDSRYYQAHSPPPIPERMNPAYNGRSQQQQSAAEIGRSSTAVPRSHRHQQQHEVASPKGIYPPLPPPLRSKTTSSTLAPFSSYQEHVEDPYASHRYRSPVYSPPPSSVASTGSASSPPTSQPQSPTRQLYPLAHAHAHAQAHAQSHGRHHSLSTNVYATDYAGNNKLVPGRSVKRHSQHAGYPSSALGAVGPALSQNIPPVLPRPPSLKGSSSTTLGRSGSLRGNVPRKGDSKTATDEEQAAYAALNTYR